MEKYKEIIASLSNGICMDFVLEKCAVFHTKCGVIFESPCVTENPLLLREDNYKYLGILECDMILLKEVKESVRYDFLSRLRAILFCALFRSHWWYQLCSLLRSMISVHEIFTLRLLALSQPVGL